MFQLLSHKAYMLRVFAAFAKAGSMLIRSFHAAVSPGLSMPWSAEIILKKTSEMNRWPRLNDTDIAKWKRTTWEKRERSLLETSIVWAYINKPATIIALIGHLLLQIVILYANFSHPKHVRSYVPRCWDIAFRAPYDNKHKVVDLHWKVRLYSCTNPRFQSPML